MGGQNTKTIDINVGSKVINNEDTARSFNVSFEVDQWKEIEEYALSGFNIEDKHCQDDQKPATFPTKHPSVSPSAIPHKNPSAEPVVIPHQIKATIPPEDGKNDDDIAVDNRKPAAKSQEEMFTTAVQEQMLTNTNLYSLVIGGQVVPWICEFCNLQWPSLQMRCGSCKRWKGGKRSSSAIKDTKEKTVSNNKGQKRGRKSKLLTSIPGQNVDIPLVVGGALVVQ